MWLVDVVDVVGDELDAAELVVVVVEVLSESSWKNKVDKTRWKYDCGLRINIVFSLAGK